jgi:hypothetical protein
MFWSSLCKFVSARRRSLEGDFDAFEVLEEHFRVLKLSVQADIRYHRMACSTKLTNAMTAVRRQRLRSNWIIVQAFTNAQIALGRCNRAATVLQKAWKKHCSFQTYMRGLYEEASSYMLGLRKVRKSAIVLQRWYRRAVLARSLIRVAKWMVIVRSHRRFLDHARGCLVRRRCHKLKLELAQEKQKKKAMTPLKLTKYRVLFQAPLDKPNQSKAFWFADGVRIVNTKEKKNNTNFFFHDNMWHLTIGAFQRTPGLLLAGGQMVAPVLYTCDRIIPTQRFEAAVADGTLVVDGEYGAGLWMVQTGMAGNKNVTFLTLFNGFWNGGYFLSTKKLVPTPPENAPWKGFKPAPGPTMVCCDKCRSVICYCDALKTSLVEFEEQRSPRIPNHLPGLLDSPGAGPSRKPDSKNPWAEPEGGYKNFSDEADYKKSCHDCGDRVYGKRAASLLDGVTLCSDCTGRRKQDANQRHQREHNAAHGLGEGPKCYCWRGQNSWCNKHQHKAQLINGSCRLCPKPTNKIPIHRAK